MTREIIRDLRLSWNIYPSSYTYTSDQALGPNQHEMTRVTGGTLFHLSRIDSTS